jgi:hypothetical protein
MFIVPWQQALRFLREFVDGDNDPMMSRVVSRWRYSHRFSDEFPDGDRFLHVTYEFVDGDNYIIFLAQFVQIRWREVGTTANLFGHSQVRGKSEVMFSE